MSSLLVGSDNVFQIVGSCLNTFHGLNHAASCWASPAEVNSRAGHVWSFGKLPAGERHLFCQSDFLSADDAREAAIKMVKKANREPRASRLPTVAERRICCLQASHSTDGRLRLVSATKEKAAQKRLNVCWKDRGNSGRKDRKWENSCGIKIPHSSITSWKETEWEWMAAAKYSPRRHEEDAPTQRHCGSGRTSEHRRKWREAREKSLWTD